MTVVITDLRGSPAPHYFPNLYVTNNYEVKGASPHTIEKVLRAIGMAKCWAETVGRNLDDDLSEGNFLSAADVISVVRFLGFNAAQQTSEYEAALAFAERTPRSRFKTTSRRTSKAEASETATAVELGNRIRWVASYLEWHRFRRFDNRRLSAIETHLNASAETTIADLRSKAPSSSAQWQDDELLEAPDVSVLKRIDDILHPNSLENPFSSEFIRWRNYLA
ncbi:hypothetical protein [Sphingobium sp. BS19]|uniref:hypothetical protein n=1 Tax=Sphingobium sp. BS19 TaxID=3018973 RepID=UPI00249273D6|nr:hypothetical protein [Sphingobium sp. BS19]